MSALDFRQISGRGLPHCNDPQHQGAGSARYRVSLLGYPLQGRLGAELRVCGHCKVRLERIYAKAHGAPPREPVAA